MDYSRGWFAFPEMQPLHPVVWGGPMIETTLHIRLDADQLTELAEIVTTVTTENKARIRRLMKRVRKLEREIEATDQLLNDAVQDIETLLLDKLNRENPEGVA